MSNKYFFLLIILLFSSCVFADKLNFELETTNPISEPYFKGTTVKEIKVDIVDSADNILSKNFDYLDLKLGDEKIKLYKKNSSYISTSEFRISNSHVKLERLIFNVETPIPGVSVVSKSFSMDQLENYAKYEFIDLKEIYNKGQEVNLNLKLEFLKPNMSIDKVYLLNPSIENNVFSCEENNCNQKFKVPSDSELLEIEILGYLNYGDKTVPLYITASLPTSEKVNLEVFNPKDGVVGNPLSLEFGLFYENGLELDIDNFKLFLDGDEKKVRKTSDNKYSINYLLFPYFSVDNNITIQHNENTYYKQLEIDLRPGTWFWVVVIVILLLIGFNVFLLIRKVLKKEDVNELIAKRDFYIDDLKRLKKDFLGGKLSKSVYDNSVQEYKLQISMLNSRILKVKQILSRKESGRTQDALNFIKDKSSEDPVDLPKFEKIDKDDLSNLMGKVLKESKPVEEPKIESKEEVLQEAIKEEPKLEGEKKPGFFSKIFSVFKRKKKSAEAANLKEESKSEKKEELKSKRKEVDMEKVEEEVNKQEAEEDYNLPSDSEFDINSWK
jgi:hypothetical protein